MYKFSLLLLILVINGFGRADVPKLLLTVYYESKCPDSRSFVLQQLQPAMRLLHEHVKMLFVPFGKATSIDYGFEGFECQHGQEECFGNMVQDCTLELMDYNGASDMDKLSYVACEMESYAATKGNLQCVSNAKVQDKIQECVYGGRGSALQLNSEYLTSLVQPKFIPTVTINHVYNQQIQDSAMKDLFGTLCSYLHHAVPCSQYFNKSALTYILHGRSPRNYYW